VQDRSVHRSVGWDEATSCDLGGLPKYEGVNFCEAYRMWWVNALVNETPRDWTVVIEGMGAR
jgi:hypothetical protein